MSIQALRPAPVVQPRDEDSVRVQTVGEERANAFSHGLALLAALLAAPFLIVQAIGVGDAAYVAGVSVFCATTVFLYMASSVFHALPAGPGKRLFLVLDHTGIFLLIAGTYTPFTLGALGGTWGWALFGAVWGLAGAGVMLRIFASRIPEYVTTVIYLAMGWMVLLVLDLLIARVPPTGLAWLVAGGLAYTLGVAFFILDWRLRFSHFIWHLFVVAGTVCHGFAIYGYGYGV